MKEFILLVCRCGKVKSYGSWRWAFKEFSAVVRDLIREKQVGETKEDFCIKFFIDKCDYCKIKEGGGWTQ